MNNFSKALIISTGLMTGAIASQAYSAPGTASVVDSSVMKTGRLTSQPIGHYEFCKIHRSECKAVSKPGPAPRVTEYGWSVIREVNTKVNFSVMPRTDMEIFGREEVWAYPDVAGDCEDYVLLKRYMLIERGFSPADLLITVVRKPDGEGHAVLTIRSVDGDYILDNLVDTVKPWHETPYRYLKRQSSDNSGRWVTIENHSPMFVGSVR